MQKNEDGQLDYGPPGIQAMEFLSTSQGYYNERDPNLHFHYHEALRIQTQDTKVAVWTFMHRATE